MTSVSVLAPPRASTGTLGDVLTPLAAAVSETVSEVTWKCFYKWQDRGRRAETVSAERLHVRRASELQKPVPRPESDGAGEAAKVSARVPGFSEGLLPTPPAAPSPMYHFFL